MFSLEDNRLENAMGRMLQIGVTVATLVVLVGGVLHLKQSPDPIPDYRQFHSAPVVYESIHGIIASLSRFDGQSLIAFGILLLVMTPICRVIFGLVGFYLLRDRFYTTVSGIVLIILLLSFTARR